jgi:hypothetical protein
MGTGHQVPYSFSYCPLWCVVRSPCQIGWSLFPCIETRGKGDFQSSWTACQIGCTQTCTATDAPYEIKTLRDLFSRKFENAATDPASARSALRLLFEERDAWADYVDDYEDTLRPWARWLFAATVLLPLAAALAFHFVDPFLDGLS